MPRFWPRRKPQLPHRWDQPALDDTVAPLSLTSRWRRYAPGVGVAAVVVLSVSIMVQLPQDNLTQSPPMPSVVLDEAFMDSPEVAIAIEEHASMPASPPIYAEDALTSNIDLELDLDLDSEREREREREQQLAEAQVAQAEAQKRQESQAKHVARARLQETEQRAKTISEPISKSSADHSAKAMMAKKQTPTFDSSETKMLNEPAVSSMALLQHDVMLEEQIEPRYRDTAASWQSHIEQLVKDKQFDEAEAEFVLFKAAFPDHPFTT